MKRDAIDYATCLYVYRRPLRQRVANTLRWAVCLASCAATGALIAYGSFPT